MHESDLKFFKEILNERKRQILENLEVVKKDIEGLNQSEANDEVDFASINTDIMIEQAISAQQRKELLEIEMSISKISNDMFGVCEMCEEDIGIQRLKVKPHARYCITCREIIEKTAK